MLDGLADSGMVLEFPRLAATPAAADGVGEVEVRVESPCLLRLRIYTHEAWRRMDAHPEGAVVVEGIGHAALVILPLD